VTVFAAAAWAEEIAAHPGRAVLASVGLLAAMVLAGYLVRAMNRRTPSLRAQVLAITLTGLLLGTVAAFALAWLMVLDGGDLATVVSVLAITSVFATGLVVVATAPLGSDVRRLETTVGRIEAGDRDARAELVRADELGHVGRALDQLNARLDQLEQERVALETERTEVLSSISHDLRTPLAALRAAVEALADGVVDDTPRYYRAMQHDVEALGALVDDLFLLVRVESGRLDLHIASIDLAEVADTAIEALAPTAAANGVGLALDTAGRVGTHGDAGALGRVVRNLLDNAIRHAPPGTTVRVSVGVDTSGPWVKVVDEGDGFTADFADRAFDHFTRADASRTRDTGGAGLGLAIARGLVEAHGGEVWIEPPPGGRVGLRLPPGDDRPVTVSR
jgi:two-component system, OmpR family, sensor histidine kinase BaeS